MDARNNAKLTQIELAVRLERPQSFVAKYELGERRVDVIEFVAIAGALGLDPGDLLDACLNALQMEGI